MKKVIIILLISHFLISCEKKKCKNATEWDSTVTYHKKDVVKYNSKYWKAEEQGRGIVPGPWLENSNDIWKECACNN